MCASYGLGGGPYDRDGASFGLDPLDTREGRAALDKWMADREGRAAITGKNARNFNPLIMAPAGERELQFGWWWLWLSGVGPARFDAFNSRDDKLMRSWRTPFQHRALLPASWYVEKKVRFTLPGEPVFAIAAITSTVIEEATGEPLLTYSMVTRDAVGEAKGTHPRMPLVLPPEMHDEWLDPERPGDAELVGEIQHASEEISAAMTAGADSKLF